MYLFSTYCLEYLSIWVDPSNYKNKIKFVERDRHLRKVERLKRCDKDNKDGEAGVKESLYISSITQFMINLNHFFMFQNLNLYITYCLLLCYVFFYYSTSLFVSVLPLIHQNSLGRLLAVFPCFSWFQFLLQVLNSLVSLFSLYVKKFNRLFLIV